MNALFRSYCWGVPIVGTTIFLGNVYHMEWMTDSILDRKQAWLYSFGKGVGYGGCSWFFPCYALIKHRLCYPDDLTAHWKMHLCPNSHLLLRKGLSADYYNRNPELARYYQSNFQFLGILPK